MAPDGRGVTDEPGAWPVRCRQGCRPRSPLPLPGMSGLADGRWTSHVIATSPRPLALLLPMRRTRGALRRALHAVQGAPHPAAGTQASSAAARQPHPTSSAPWWPGSSHHLQRLHLPPGLHTTCASWLDAAAEVEQGAQSARGSDVLVVEVVTGDVRGAGCTAPASLTLFGELGACAAWAASCFPRDTRSPDAPRLPTAPGDSTELHLNHADDSTGAPRRCAPPLCHNHLLTCATHTLFGGRLCAGSCHPRRLHSRHAPWPPPHPPRPPA